VIILPIEKSSLKECMNEAFSCHQYANSIKGNDGISNIGWECGVCGRRFVTKSTPIYFGMLRQLTEVLTEILDFHEKEIKPNFEKFAVVNVKPKKPILHVYRQEEYERYLNNTG